MLINIFLPDCLCDSLNISKGSDPHFSHGIFHQLAHSWKSFGDIEISVYMDCNFTDSFSKGFPHMLTCVRSESNNFVENKIRFYEFNYFNNF